MLKKYIYTFITIISSITLSNNCPWAVKDLEFAKNMIIENHPGIHNQLDPLFRENLELAYQKSIQALAQSTSEIVCKKILKEFAQALGDAHLSINFPIITFKPALLYSFKKEPFSSSHITPNICWIRIPTFESNNATILEFEKIVTALPAERTMPYIVFDLRGNTGGSSFWGEQIVYALFGVDYINYRRTLITQREYVEWRVSLSTINYWEKEVIPFMDTHFPADSKEVIWAHTILRGLTKAYLDQKLYYQEDTLPEPGTQKPASPLYTGKVLVILDEHCNSACLDFIDELKHMAPHLKLIGHNSAADNIYMEVRTIALPSKKGTLNLPLKVARNRIREHNEPHKPDYLYNGNMYDIKIIQQYVLCLIHYATTIKDGILYY